MCLGLWGMQIWWIGNTLRRQGLHRPPSESGLLLSLERIRQKEYLFLRDDHDTYQQDRPSCMSNRLVKAG
jgi:hypothetical protein